MIEIDEFSKILIIYASNCSEAPLTLENFPPGRMHKFLLVLNYLVHLSAKASKKKIMRHINWNFLLNRQKKTPILEVFPCMLSKESQAKMQSFHLKQDINYKIESFNESDNEALELLVEDSPWRRGNAELKLNSLYIFESSEASIPSKICFLPEITQVSQLDSDLDEFLLEIAFESESVLFQFDKQTNLTQWKSLIEEGKSFEASSYYNGESVHEVKEVVVALDRFGLINFNLKNGRFVKENCLLFAHVQDSKLHETRTECTLVCCKN